MQGNPVLRAVRAVVVDDDHFRLALRDKRRQRALEVLEAPLAARDDAQFGCGHFPTGGREAPPIIPPSDAFPRVRMRRRYANGMMLAFARKVSVLEPIRRRSSWNCIGCPSGLASLRCC